MDDNLISRKEAAQRMGISECTLSRCVKLGAPVHRRGSTGHRYLVDVPVFTQWMEVQNSKAAKEQREIKVIDLTVEELAARRQEMMRGLKAKETTP